MKHLCYFIAILFIVNLIIACDATPLSQNNSQLDITPNNVVQDNNLLCTAEMLQSSVESEGGAGWIFVWISYINTTDQACHIAEAPRITLFDSDMRAIRANYQYTHAKPPDSLSNVSVKQFRLLPGASITLTLRWESRCPPETTRDIVAHLLLSTPADIEQTLLKEGERFCDPMFKEHGPVTPIVIVEGFII